MVVDYIRTCYATDVYIDPACTVKRRIKYFWAAPGAKEFPGGTVFSSSDWGILSGPDWGPGEDPLAVRTYSKGELPPGLNGRGNFCGQEQWFHDGAPADAPPVKLVGGVPSCCVGNVYVANLGLKLGLQTVQPCQPFVSWPSAQLLFSDGTWRNMDSSHPGIPNSWYLGMRELRQSEIIQGFLSSSDPACVFFRLWVAYRDRSFFIDMVNLGPDPDHPGAYVWFGNFTDAVFPFTARASIRFGFAPAPASLGLKLGWQSSLSVVAALGLKLGLASELVARLESEAGLKLGLESELRSTAEAVLGVKLGLQTSLAALVDSEAGLKLGLASALRGVLASSLGLQLGMATQLRGTVSSALGIKLGFASTLFPGIATSCCPTSLTPQTLNGTGSAGTGFTATWSAANGGWPFVDPDSGVGFVLKCVNTGAAFQWQATNPTAGCTKTYSVQSLVCNPFNLHCRTVLGGGSCIFAGTYNFTFSA